MRKDTLKRAVGYLLLTTALIACPCHLVFLLPLVLGLVGGTTLGVLLTTNTGLIIGGATIYFVGALGAGLYLLNRQAGKGASCPRTSSGRKRTLPLKTGQTAGHANSD